MFLRSTDPVRGRPAMAKITNDFFVFSSIAFLSWCATLVWFQRDLRSWHMHTHTHTHTPVTPNQMVDKSVVGRSGSLHMSPRQRVVRMRWFLHSKQQKIRVEVGARFRFCILGKCHRRIMRSRDIRQHTSNFCWSRSGGNLIRLGSHWGRHSARICCSDCVLSAKDMVHPTIGTPEIRSSRDQ